MFSIGRIITYETYVGKWAMKLVLSVHHNYLQHVLSYNIIVIEGCLICIELDSVRFM